MALDGADNSSGKKSLFDPETGEAKPLTLSSQFSTSSDPHDPIIAAERRRRERIFTLLNLGRNADTAKTVGHMSLTGKRDSEEIALERTREEDDLHFTMRMVQREIDAQIAALDAQLAAIDDRLRQIDERLEAVADAEQLYAEGKLDLSNPAHRALLLRASIEPEDFEADPAGALARARSENEAGRDYWRRQRDDVVRKRDAAEQLRARADAALTPEEQLAVAEEFAKLRQDGEATLLDQTTTKMSDRSKVQAIEAASGFNAEEQKQAVLALGAGQSGFGREGDVSGPRSSPPKPAL